jgi:hypothetical protein
MTVRSFLKPLFWLGCVFAIAPAVLSAQEPQTIRIKKESDLAKAVLDNTEFKLVVIDRFGNPRTNRILSYKLWVKNGKSTREFEGHSNSLSPEMLNYLNSQPSAVKIFFTEIMVEDDHETASRLPDVIETWFPDCKNCTPTKRKRR